MKDFTLIRHPYMQASYQRRTSAKTAPQSNSFGAKREIGWYLAGGLLGGVFLREKRVSAGPALG